MKAVLLPSGKVKSPFSLREHVIEDYAFSRMLHEKCYFRCPDTGNEFEIIVRKKVPSELSDVAATTAPPPPVPIDEPGTMGGEPFDVPAEAEAIEAQAEDDEEEADKDEVAAEETEEAADEEEEEEKTESLTAVVLSLVEGGMEASKALDLVEMCGYDPQAIIQQSPMGLGMASGIMGGGAPMPPQMIPGAVPFDLDDFDDEDEVDFAWGGEPEMEG